MVTRRQSLRRGGRVLQNIRPSIELLEDRRLLASIPMLSSDPAAPAQLYLDFDGHYTGDWGGEIILGYREHGDVSTPAFDMDGNSASVSAAEAAVMNQVWRAVAEDFAPFNLNVTTVEPTSMADGRGLRIAIGGSYRDWYDEPSTGVAQIDAFTNDHPNVAFVFSSDILAVGDNDAVARAIATTVSHEAGHSFGLEHQSLYDVDRVQIEYHPGTTEWVPIMGNSLANTRSTWHSGATVLGSGTRQDDMAIIGRPENRFGFRADDHGSDAREATALEVALSADDRARFDLDVEYHASGIIETIDDVDYFVLRSDVAGQMTVQVSTLGGEANLDSTLRVYERSDLVTLDDPGHYEGGPYGLPMESPVPDDYVPPDAGDYFIPDDLDASATLTIVPDRHYYIAVGSHGMYGDVGQYDLSITVIPDRDPPYVTSSHAVVTPFGPSILLTYNETIDPDSVSVDDVLVRDMTTGRLVPVASAAVVHTGALGAGDPTNRVSVRAPLRCGRDYSMNAGPRISDLNGNDMDQNHNGVPGEAIVDQYQMVINIPCEVPRDPGPEHPGIELLRPIVGILQEHPLPFPPDFWTGITMVPIDWVGQFSADEQPVDQYPVDQAGLDQQPVDQSLPSSASSWADTVDELLSAGPQPEPPVEWLAANLWYLELWL